MSKTVCFTGHRKIGGIPGGDPDSARYLGNHLVNVIKRAMDSGVKTFISGGAIGVDLIAAHATKLAGGRLVMAIPFVGQESKWPEKSQRMYRKMLAQADESQIVSTGGYAPWKMQKRNIWMVDHSDYVIACWTGVEKGGTYNCIQYALSKGKPVLHIHPQLLTEKWLNPQLQGD